MRFSLAALALASASSMVEAGCIADNCARAVTATPFGTATIAARKSDCSSYLLVTVTPDATYVNSLVYTM